MSTQGRRPRLVIASRIFTPEPAAASFFLENCARAFAEAGWDVRVLTSTYLDSARRSDASGVEVRRAPVIRNAAGYIRGYISYLSFDVPLFFRLLFMRRADLILVEPPPTTGVVVRVAAWLRRIPYVYDAADIWSDAAVTTTNSRLVLRVLRSAERFAIRGARHAFVVAQAYADRMREIDIRTPTSVSGFGVDTATFDYQPGPPASAPLFVYGGSYSEWHGADIFVAAFARFVGRHPDARLIFVGNGSERPALTRLAAELNVAEAVEFRDPVPGVELSVILGSATSSLASLNPGMGYDYAFATKVFSSLAVGCPVIFTGAGPAGPFISEAATEVRAGVAVSYDVAAVDSAMEQLASAPLNSAERQQLSVWTRSKHSMRMVAERIVATASHAVHTDRL
jgi:glycosyltransferase involved in cell wall biosynthesis